MITSKEHAEQVLFDLFLLLQDDQVAKQKSTDAGNLHY